MDIDLFTWAAQIVNFVILMVLLRRFLYGRIIGAIDAREDRIASRWREAEQERDKASQEAQSYAAQRRELEETRNEKLAQAEEEVESRKQQWIEEARREVDRARDNWFDALRKQQQSFLEDLRRTATKGIVDAVQRILREIADENLQGQVLRQFSSRVAGSDDQGHALADFIRQTRKGLTVNTAFDLSQQQQEDLRTLIQDKAGESVDIRFATSKGLICGVELRADGRKMGWSIQDYLGSLEEQIRDRLERRVQDGPAEKQAAEAGEHG